MFVLTNHAHVLMRLSANPRARLRDIAEIMGIVERAEQLIVAELEVAGYLDREREGHRNVHRFNAPMREHKSSHLIGPPGSSRL